MGSTTDKAKGRVEEAAGKLTDNDRLAREGKADRISGEVKETAENLKDKAGDAVDKVKDKVKDALD